MDIKLGNLYIKKPKQLLAACEILRAFDFASSVGDATAMPLSITLQGLTSGSLVEQREETTTFCAPILTAPWLKQLDEDLAAAFKRQEVPYAASTKSYPGARLPYQIQLVNLSLFRTDSRATKQRSRNDPWTRNHPSLKVPHFKAGDIYEKYADKVWVKNLPLDRICLRTKGIKDVIKRDEIVGSGFEDILSVPLSGAPETTLKPRDPEIKYQKGSDYKKAGQIIMPFITSSETKPRKVRHRS